MTARLVAIALPTLLLSTVWAQAAPLRPHQAVYDLSLAEQTEDVLAVEGRIAFVLNGGACGDYDLDYRFAARFHQDGETTLTDQRTLSSEKESGRRFDFETRTFVDGLDQGVVRGSAINDGDTTDVTMQEPVIRTFDLPLARFPLSHTGELIAQAKGGARFVESRLFDGDVEGEKQMSTTSIILPVAEGAVRGGGVDKLAGGLGGLASWMVDESYFNSDSDEDGMPIFRARYRLYENGVSDEMLLDFGDYVLAGQLASLKYLDPKACD